MTRFRALKHRNFQLFIAGQLVSLIGTWMQTTRSYAGLRFDRTHLRCWDFWIAIKFR